MPVLPVSPAFRRGCGWLVALAVMSAAAVAQVQRPFPQNALRGVMVVTQPPEITLNGAAARLSPGARIRGYDNLLVMSGAIVGQKLPVHYTVDLSGEVHDVWLLRADELANQPWPRTAAEATAWRFDPAAQTWTRP